MYNLYGNNKLLTKVRLVSIRSGGKRRKPICSHKEQQKEEERRED
jgi:hypothetical protein